MVGLRTVALCCRAALSCSALSGQHHGYAGTSAHTRALTCTYTDHELTSLPWNDQPPTVVVMTGAPHRAQHCELLTQSRSRSEAPMLSYGTFPTIALVHIALDARSVHPDTGNPDAEHELSLRASVDHDAVVAVVRDVLDATSTTTAEPSLAGWLRHLTNPASFNLLTATPEQQRAAAHAALQRRMAHFGHTGLSSVRLTEQRCHDQPSPSHSHTDLTELGICTGQTWCATHNRTQSLALSPALIRARNVRYVSVTGVTQLAWNMLSNRT